MFRATELSSGAGTVDRMDRGGAGQVVLELPCSGQGDRIDEVQRQVDVLLEGGPRTLVVDMPEGVSLSSSTIAALMWVRRRASTRGVELILGEADRRVVETLLRSGLFGTATPEASGVGDAPRGPAW